MSNFTRLFIERPVATSLLTLGITLAGLLAFIKLPVASLPEIDVATIAVQAQLAGANPETMAATVATPLERALGRIAGITEMTSSSSQGSTRVTMQFDLDRDVNAAAREVQAAINAARNLLPSSLNRNPTYNKFNPANAPIMDLALTSDSMNMGQLYDVADSILAQKFAQVEGIGQVDVDGGSQPAVRIDLNPKALAKYGIDTETVRTAVVASNANRPKGFIEDDEQHWQIAANDQAKVADDYKNLIIATVNGVVVRLSDVANVQDSVQDVRNFGSANGQPAVLIHLRRQPGANVVETIDHVKTMLPQLRASIPSAITLSVVLDRTPSIRASLHDIEFTLLLSIALVIAVVFIFLRNARATLIPAVAVPVSLIGTFIVMYFCGYNLDNLSLMALTVATGFVVDDAIVVLENVSRHLEKGESALEAALKGSQEVASTVVSMSISLVAVFIPLLLMSGLIGRLLREFAVTMSVAVMISLVVSLTTTPMMCALFLKPQVKPEPQAEAKPQAARYSLLQAFENAFERLRRFYQVSLRYVLQHGLVTLLVLFAVIGLNVYLYIASPKGFFPQQDSGRISGNIVADQATSFQAMRKKLDLYIDIVKHDPAVEAFTAGIGGGQSNSGRMLIALKPRTQRDVSDSEFIARIRKKTARVTGAKLTLQSEQDIRVGGRTAGAQYQYTLQADRLSELRLWENKIKEALSANPLLLDVNSDSQDNGSQTVLTVDRDKASKLGISMQQLDSTLNNLFGQRQISTIYNALNQYKVVMQAAPQYAQSPQVLRDVQLVSTQTDAAGNQIVGQVPLMSIASFAPNNTPLTVNHQGQFAASTISFNLAEGGSLSQATKVINDTMASIGVPNSVHGSFQGTAKVFEKSLKDQPWLIVTAIISIYIVLGMLYESYIHPVTILSTLPSAGIGALLALMLFNIEFDIMALIGVLLLVGIVKKNAIMMIDFAIDAERTQGLSAKEAIFTACQMRFRPILMTTTAALLGALPLAIGFGEGFEFRQPLGVAIVGGLLVSQLLTLYTTPVIYIYLDRFAVWLKSSDKRASNSAEIRGSTI